MQPSPRRPHYALHLSICPVPTVNKKTEHCTTFKFWQDFTYVRINWQSNFQVKRLKVKVTAVKLCRSWCISFAKNASIHVKPGWRPHSTQHILSDTVQQRKCVLFKVTGDSIWSSRLTVCRECFVCTPSITPSLFQSRLKTYLFNKSFPP